MGVTSAAAATPTCGDDDDDDGNSNDGNCLFHCDDDKMDSESKNISGSGGCFYCCLLGELMLVFPFLKVFRKPAIRGGEEHEGKMGPCLSP